SGLIVLPGSFNPLHEGHKKLAAAAQKVLSKPLLFELSVKNVDKADISREEVFARIVQFQTYANIAVTYAPRFVQKAEIFPGATFTIGFDTAERIVSPKYYSSKEDMIETVSTIGQFGCNFLVACRAKGEKGYGQGSRIFTLDDLEIESRIKGLFRPIPPELFRLDISSSEIREKAKK
ncbi:MAG: hypothetical protein JNN15_20725, partial [Blastocatellia bacterium]|nr:hypothetical protein [Blastocatellia bacterium]